MRVLSVIFGHPRDQADMVRRKCDKRMSATLTELRRVANAYKPDSSFLPLPGHRRMGTFPARPDLG